MGKDDKKSGEVDLSKVEYKTTEHSIELDALEAKLSTEIGSAHGYSFATGIGSKLRKTLTEDYTKLNQLTPPPETPEWLKFLKQMSGFFSLLLWFGAALCFLGFGLKKDLDNLYLGIVLSSVVLITGVFSYLQESKSSNLMKQFAALTAQKVLVRTGAGKSEDVPAAHLCRGDIVFMKGGVKVPADMRVVESVELKVSNAPLTGEADAIELKTGPEELETKPQDLTNWTFFGTDVEAGTGWGVVTAIGDDTYMGKVAQLTMNTKAEETPINKEIEHFIFIVSGVAIFLGVGFFVIGIFLGTDWITNLVFAIGIIVANVPEGLLATVTVCLSLTAKTMATKMVLVKNMEGVETLGSTTCICSDKTGTLTQNVMTFANLIYDMSIFCTELIEERTYAPANRASPTFQAFLNCMKLNTTAFFDPADVEQRELFKHSSRAGAAPVISWKVQGDASESAIIRFAQYMSFSEREEARLNNSDKMLEARTNVRAACEIPFNSALKYHMVIRQSGTNAAGEEVVNEHPESPYCVYMKGAAERILARCDHALLENVPVPLDDENNYRAVIDKHLNTMMAKGRRCLGFAYKRLPVEEYPIGFEFDKRNASLNFPMGEAPLGADGARHQGLTFVGIACLIDPPRPAVPTAVLSCQTAGIRVVMVTGDHPKTARAIARMVNIIGQDSLAYDEIEELNKDRGVTEGQDGWQNPLFAPAIVIPGWEISPNTSDERWRFIFAHDEIVFARTSPAQKLMIVKHFQELESEIVAVTGDGVNDAPALKKADIGVAMNITGTDVAKGAADMILLDDNFASIVAGVEEGRLIFDNLKKSIAYTLSSNIPEISPFLCFITVRTPLPLSTVLILCIDLGTDMVPAISMAWEGPEADIMRRPPRNAAVDRLVTRKLVAFAYLQIGIIQAAAGFFTWMVVLNDYGYAPSVLAGLGSFDNWGKQILYCKVTGGQWRDLNGDATTKTGAAAIDAGFMFWDQGAEGIVDACTFPTKNFKGGLENAIGALNTEDLTTFYNAADNSAFTAGFDVPTRESIDALKADGYSEFMPYRARISPFFDQAWLSWDIKETGPPGMGPDVDPTLVFTVQNPVSWSIAGQTATSDAGQGESAANDLLAASAVGTSDMFDKATAFQASVGTPDKYSLTTMEADGTIRMNIASRMMQKEALHHAQCAYFVSIVVVQWADLMICKTRWLSIRQQGMRNPAMNFGLVFETILAAFICYLPGVGDALGTRPIRLTHWAPAIPFSIAIFLYDETRKKLMREYSTELRVGKQILRDYGWLARQTYY